MSSKTVTAASVLTVPYFAETSDRPEVSLTSAASAGEAFDAVPPPPGL